MADESNYFLLQDTQNRRIYYCYKKTHYKKEEAIQKAARTAHKSAAQMYCLSARETADGWKVMQARGDFWCVTRDGA